MHRKKIRRWHKLLSASGIIVAVFGALVAPSAIALPGGPIPDGIYGPRFTKEQTFEVYFDFQQNVLGLENSDLYFTGSASGCQLDPIPQIPLLSVSVTMRDCSDGSLQINLKADSIKYDNDVTGPDVDFQGVTTLIDRTPLLITIAERSNITETSNFEWVIDLNHPFVPSQSYSLELIGPGCLIAGTRATSTGIAVSVSNCLSSTNAQLVIWPDAFTDLYGNRGPSQKIYSAQVYMNFSPPPPTPTASPTPTPTATATASPTPTPTSTPTPSATTAVAIPVEPPPAPPVEPPAAEAAPEPVLEPIAEIDQGELAVTPSPISILPKVKFTRIPVAKPIATTQMPEPELPVVDYVPPVTVAPVLESEPEPESFDWQPIGYGAIFAGLSALGVGGVLFMRRVKLGRRALRFS